MTRHEKIEHADPNKWATDMQTALDEFEKALTQRYEEELDNLRRVWAPGHETSQPEIPIKNPVDQGQTTVEFSRAKDHIPGWVEEIRRDIESAIPQYSTHDLAVINSAFSNFEQVAALLEGGDDMKGDKDGRDDEDETSTISAQANTIIGRSSGSNGNEFAAWAGISHDTFHGNFGQSVLPTIENQRAIAKSLFKLYIGRACLIEQARKNSLAAIQEGTTQLGGTVDHGDASTLWLTLSVSSLVVGIGSALAGAALGVAAVMGDIMDGSPLGEAVDYENDIESVVTGVRNQLKQVEDTARENASDWRGKIAELRNAIANAPSNELELYDFSGTSGDSSTRTAGAFDVDPGAVEELATACLEVSDEYEPLIQLAITTEDADPHLKGLNDVVTTGDTALKDTRDTFVSLLQTTCARYHEAGSRLTTAAEAYYGVEEDNTRILEALAQEVDLNGQRAGTGGTVEEHIIATKLDG